jgi:ATP-binding cassette subfamily B protein
VTTRDTKLLGRLWAFVRPHARYLYASLALLVVTAAAGLVRPLLMLRLIDVGAIGKNPDAVASYGWILLGIVVVEQALTFYQVFTMQIAGARAMADLRAHVFCFLHTRRLGFFDRQPIGRLVTRVTNDTDAISEMFASGALNAVGDLIRLVGIVVMMLALDWRLSLIAFAALPPVALFVNWMRAGSRRAFRDIRLRTAELNALLDEQVSGMAVVQALCHEDASAAEFDQANRGYRNAYIRSIKFEATIDAAVELVAGVCVALVLVAAGFHAASVGTIVAFVAYIKQFFEPVSNLAQRYTLLQSAMSGAEKVFDLLDTGEAEPSRTDGAGAPRLATVPAAFSLEQVSFHYRPDVAVLHDVSIHAELGETIAIVGATGSGKTTVTSLLLRLYEPQGGVVRVLGRDVRSYDPSELRRQFAVVPQDVYLFPGTIASNVSVGAASPDRARVRAALESVCALDLFDRRPGGIDGPVDERGANFSAGERQLIAFARALYRDPPILILDEATANIDSETESRVQKALSILMKGRTALVIAHRLSTIRAAHRIVVIHKGRLVEEGTHEELLARGGAYAKLYRLRYAQDAA